MVRSCAPKRRKPPNKASIGDGSGGKEKPGETKERWMDCIKKDLAEKEWEAQYAAECLHWKTMTSNGDSTWKWDKPGKKKESH